MSSEPDAASLWIVDPSVRHPEHQGVEQILQDWSGRHRVFRPALSAGDGPALGDGYDVDAVVVMGSAVSVHESLPWARTLSDWLKPILDAEVVRPVLGICYGHQLVAHLAGGDVGFCDEGGNKRVGIETSNLFDGRLLPAPQSLEVVVSHREEVKREPPGYRVVASRGPIAIDGLEHDSLPIFSFQFHPEAREEFAAHAGIAPERLTDRVRKDAQRLLGAFRDLVRKRGQDTKLDEL